MSPAKSSDRVRLDRLMVDLGLAPSRERAQALIIAGQVIVGDHAVTKPGQPVDAAAEVRVKGEPMPYVSRGGLKLAHALDRFGLDPTGVWALDVGASTGGFTDVLLQRGAERVCALDVGYNQLAWSLRNDPRVVCLERVNAREVAAAALPFPPEALVADVSFISLTLVLPHLLGLAAEHRWPLRWCVCLIKPQFEVGKGEVGKGGVVREEDKRLAAVAKVRGCLMDLGCDVLGVETSPIVGPAGNVEYLIAFRPPTR